jgi:DNA-binding NarL/FixJ family response regulator
MPKTTLKPHSPSDPFGKLTAKEREVSTALLLDLGDKQIASRLGCSTRTIEAHLRAIRQKLGVHSRVGVALKLTGVLR